MKLLRPIRSITSSSVAANLLALLFLTALVEPAMAQRLCGALSKVFPILADVPCDCGDTVVGNTTLTEADPIVMKSAPGGTPCEGNGLSLSAGFTLDLNNQEIRGNGRTGIGIVIGSGGTLMGPGMVTDFRVGVQGTNGSLIVKVTANRNAENGIAVVGDGNGLSENKVFNSRTVGKAAVSTQGCCNSLFKNTVGDAGQGNAGIGISVDGASNLVLENEVFDNGSDGILVNHGTPVDPRNPRDPNKGPNELVKNKVGEFGKSNKGIGIRVLPGDVGNGAARPARRIELDDNEVTAEHQHAILVQGPRHKLRKNKILFDPMTFRFCAYLVAPGNIDRTDNEINGERIDRDNNVRPFPGPNNIPGNHGMLINICPNP